MSSLLEFEVLPGSSDRTGASTIAHYWWMHEEKSRNFLIAAHQMAEYIRSARSLDVHCEKHPNDEQANERRLRLLEVRSTVFTEYVSAADAFAGRDPAYHQEMLRIAKIPLQYRSGALVSIIDKSGSVKIEFGPGLLGCYILRANGDLERRHEPPDPS